MNKREFIIAGCAGVVGGVGWVAQCDARGVASVSSDELARSAEWQQLLGRIFALQTAPYGALALQEVRGRASASRHEEFTLVFAGEASTPSLHASTFVLRRPDGRPVALYLEPLTNDPATRSRRYAAHFSMLL